MLRLERMRGSEGGACLRVAPAELVPSMLPGQKLATKPDLLWPRQQANP
jgi:hypothetical protein